VGGGGEWDGGEELCSLFQQLAGPLFLVPFERETSHRESDETLAHATVPFSLCRFPPSQAWYFAFLAIAYLSED